MYYYLQSAGACTHLCTDICKMQERVHICVLQLVKCRNVYTSLKNVNDFDLKTG